MRKELHISQVGTGEFKGVVNFKDGSAITTYTVVGSPAKDMANVRILKSGFLGLPKTLWHGIFVLEEMYAQTHPADFSLLRADVLTLLKEPGSDKYPFVPFIPLGYVFETFNSLSEFVACPGRQHTDFFRSQSNCLNAIRAVETYAEKMITG